MGKLFEDKVALITGGGSGIGRAAALLFAQEGAKVVISNRRIEKGEEVKNLIISQGGEASFIQADLLKEDEIIRLMDKIINIYGKLDHAFNCAGFDGDRTLLHLTTLDDWNKIMNTNLTGTFLLLKYEIEQMLKQKKGSIVNMSSVSGFFGRKGRSAYNASRSAITNLTKTAANEYIKDGIRINAIAPGAVDTDLFKHMTQNNQEIRKKYEMQHPIGRIAQPDEIAEVALWLCSEKSSFIVGQTIMVDGGGSIAGGS